jgi:hypothetical protein
MKLLAIVVVTALTATALTDQGHEAVHLANLERQKHGLPPLKLAEREDAAARWMAADLARRNVCSHTDSLGRGFGERARQFGIASAAGENCAAGHPDAKSVIAGWMKSPGHRANMLKPESVLVGVGYAAGTQGFRHYWTMVLSRADWFPVVIEREAPSTQRATVELYLFGAGSVRSIRLANDDEPFGPWIPHRRTVEWNLSEGKGLKRVRVEMMDALGRVFWADDTIMRR